MKKPVNKEAFKMLAIEIGLNNAARKLGIPIPTAKSWARRGKWKLPKRKGGGSPKAYAASSPHPVADALDATHKELEDATKTAFMRVIYKAVKAAAEKEALDISNPAQLQAACLAAARIYGWKGDSQVNVAVNAEKAGLIVVTEEKRRELQLKLQKWQLDNLDNDSMQPAKAHVVSPPARQTQSAGQHGAGDGSPEAVVKPAGKAVEPFQDLGPNDNYEPQQEEPESRYSVGL